MAAVLAIYALGAGCDRKICLKSSFAFLFRILFLKESRLLEIQASFGLPAASARITTIWSVTPRVVD